MKTEPPVTIRDLYPEMSDEQLKKAAWNLQRYAQILWRIHQRLSAANPSSQNPLEALDKEANRI